MSGGTRHTRSGKYNMNGLEVILAALRGRGAKVREVKPGHFMATCPSHDDHVPSLSLALGDNSTPLIKCMAGCDTEVVLKDLGLTWPMILGDIETGIDPAWFQRFEPRRRAGAEPECAGCEIVSVCGGCCLDWARKDSHGNGWFSPTECAYRRGLVKAAKEFLERVKGRPLVMHAIRDRLDLCNREWRPKRKGE
jgi:radical SAM protein with 4Fe4S-binding SPASM domain